MPLSDFLTAEVIGLIVAIVGLFGGAMFWLGKVSERQSSIKKDIDSIKGDLNELTIEFKADLFVFDFMALITKLIK